MNILTFDVEEWFHILDNSSTKTEDDWGQYASRIDQNMDRIFDFLEARDQKATFFCLGWVAKHHPHIIKRICNYGHEIATHSNLHQLAYEQTPKDFKADLQHSISLLEDISGQKIRAYRAPGFSLVENNKWVFDILIEVGIEIDCSIFPASRAHGGFKAFGEETPSIVQCSNGQIKEFPINTHRIFGKDIIFSGGGYFRLIPYFLIDLFLKNSPYTMTYFHPRDFDHEQPMISELSLFRKFKSYYGLKNAAHKLEKILDRHTFINLSEAEQAVNWAEAPKVTL